MTLVKRRRAIDVFRSLENCSMTMLIYHHLEITQLKYAQISLSRETEKCAAE